jgi:hypothetical protein
MPKLQPNVVVFSKGKPEMTYTAKWFKKHEFAEATYVVSPGDDVDLYRRTTGCDVIVSDSHNLPSKRQWVLDNFTSDKCPWVLFFEDNIKRVTRVAKPYYDLEEIKSTTREMYHSLEIGPQEVICNMLEDIVRAEGIGTYLGGYSSNDNHFFRKKKYRTVAFVWTKMGYMRRGGPEWPVYLDEKDDYGMTAECLKFCGRVLVNNYLYPWSKRFEGRGGSPTLEQRAPGKKKCVKILLERFPGLFREKNRSGYPEGTEIQLRFHSEKQVDLWRRGLA